VTKLGTLGEINDEKICEIVEGRRPVKSFFFIIKSGKLYDQKQPIIYKV